MLGRLPSAEPPNDEVRKRLPGHQPAKHVPFYYERRDGGARHIPVKTGLAEMLKGGVIMDVTNADQAKIAEDAGACAVMALERVPADIGPRAASPGCRIRR